MSEKSFLTDIQPTPAELEILQKYKKRSQLAEIWRRLRKNKAAVIGLIMLVIIFLAAIFADVIYDYDDILQEARMRVDTLSADEKAELLEMIAKEKADKAIRDIIERNFRKVQADVRGIIDRECSQPQDIIPVKDEGIDFRMVDPFA